MALYRLLTDLLAPAITLYLRRRMSHGREDAARFPERLGQPSLTRPNGKLVWIHAASVGESMSALPLISALLAADKAASFLLTTGTVASARVIAPRLPPRAFHQYVPVDRMPYVSRFLDHWKPDAALWVESELWPNMLASIRERGIPAALVNGRMSEKSFRRWKTFAPSWAAYLLGAFRLGLAQSEADRRRFAALGLRDARHIGNLKYAAQPQPCDERELESLRKSIGDRPLWLMASTHAGEEEIALAVHRKAAKKIPSLLTIIVPRHATRGSEVAGLADKAGLSFSLRSLGKNSCPPDASVYIADTMGEMGLFFRLAKVAVVAGSFTWEGHNPIEAAQLGCAVIFGPRMGNFAEIAEDMLDSGAAMQVKDEAELAQTVERLLAAPQETERMSAAGILAAAKGEKILQDALNALSGVIK